MVLQAAGLWGYPVCTDLWISLHYSFVGTHEPKCLSSVLRNANLPYVYEQYLHGALTSINGTCNECFGGRGVAMKP